MTMTSYNIHFSILFLPAKQALSIVIEMNAPFVTFFLPLTFFIIRAIKYFVRVKFSFQNQQIQNSSIFFPPASSLIILSSFTINSCFNSRRMISRVVTSVNSFLNVGVDIFVNIFGLNFICERVGDGEE